MKYRAAMFDMDGTVLSTEEDLSFSLNYALGKMGYQNDYSPAAMKSFFGSGIYVAIKRAIASQKGYSAEDLLKIGTPEEKDLQLNVIDETVVGQIQKIFKEDYAVHCAVYTRPYDGILQVINEIKNGDVKTAIVSNKPNFAVQELTQVYFRDLFDLSIGEQEMIRRKPAPDMLLWAIEQLHMDPSEVVYIGDTEVDAETAENAGVDCIGVTWGFRDEAYLRDCGIKYIAHTAEELRRYILED